jgi:predicted nucleotide-binding protein
MTLPTRTTVDDIKRLSKYLASKPTGASTNEAKKVLDSKYLDGRKIAALKFLGLLQVDGGRMKLTAEGREAARDDSGLARILRASVQNIEAYRAVVERAAHRLETSLSAVDVAAHWHDHFSSSASDTDSVLNDQVISFFQILEGAELGKLVLGRRGSPTRIDLDVAAVAAVVGLAPMEAGSADLGLKTVTERQPTAAARGPVMAAQTSRERRVFITHGKNERVLAQIKEIVTFGKFTPVVAQEHETTSKPIPDKVLDEMRSCIAGIIHIAGEEVLMDKDGRQLHRINENVLIEIGAAMALYKRNFILLVERSIDLPSNLQGLYECRYEGEKLDGDATMKLLKAFNEFTQEGS